MIFIEARKFTELIDGYLSDDEYAALQWYLLNNPDAGELIRGTGGVRKMRWALKGTGKSGGIRVIYFWKKSEDEIWLLTTYAKSQQSTIPAHLLKQIAEAILND